MQNAKCKMQNYRVAQMRQESSKLEMASGKFQGKADYKKFNNLLQCRTHHPKFRIPNSAFKNYRPPGR
jgi:hypothetical protein